jgi:hypothetical protein
MNIQQAEDGGSIFQNSILNTLFGVGAQTHFRCLVNEVMKWRVAEFGLES